jgi:hypothetical protein
MNTPLPWHAWFLRLLEPQELAQVEAIARLIAEREGINPLHVLNHELELLQKQYGFSRRKGHDSVAGLFSTEGLTPEQQALLDEIEAVYRRGTARTVAQHFGVPYTPALAKRLHRLFPKNMGRGGKRKGAGRKSK